MRYGQLQKHVLKILDEVAMAHFLPVRADTPKWSETCVCRWQAVWPTYNALQHWHLKELTTWDLKPLGTLSLRVKKWERCLVQQKMKQVLIVVSAFFLDKVFSPKPLVHTAPKRVLYFCLPFTGIHLLQIHKQISSIFSSAFPHLNIFLNIFLTFLPLRTGFLRVWDLVLSILLSVNAVVHCMWAKHSLPFTYTSLR